MGRVHQQFPSTFQAAVLALLSCAQHSESPISSLPPDILHYLLNMLPYSWFNVEGKDTLVSKGKSQPCTYMFNMMFGLYFIFVTAQAAEEYLPISWTFGNYARRIAEHRDMVIQNHRYSYNRAHRMELESEWWMGSEEKRIALAIVVFIGVLWVI